MKIFIVFFALFLFVLAVNDNKAQGDNAPKSGREVLADTNNFIILRMNSDDTLITAAQFRDYADDSVFIIVPKTRDLELLRQMSHLVKNCYDVWIDCQYQEDIRPLLRLLAPELSANLVKLTIYNYNEKTLPDEILEFPRLTSFFLYGRNLKAFPKVIYRLKNLRYLGISQFSFTGMPEGISKLTKLEKIEFKNCKIRTLPKDLSKLKYIKGISFLWCDNLSYDNLHSVLSKIDHRLDFVRFMECNIQTMTLEKK